MRISYFFRSSWILQLTVGIGLFLCSFFIEYRILKAFISPPLMAFFLAVTLEIGKITAIVWHYYLNHLSSYIYPGSVRLTSVLFRLGLVVLSLVCSQLFLNARLDRPNLESVKAAEMEAVEQRLHADAQRLDRQHFDRKNAMHARHKTEYTNHSARYAGRIEQLEALLFKEMNNVVGGVFRGPRYEEFERQLRREKTTRDTAMDKLRRLQLDEMSRLEDGHTLSRKQVLMKAEKKRQQLVADDFADDERVNDPYIVAFLKVTHSILHATLQPLQFVFLFSLLLSMLMEAGIILAFSTITVAMAPVLKAQHEEALEKETLKVRVGGEAERDEMRHDAAMDKITKAGRRTVEKAVSNLYTN
jgi:uncharacterized membrane protein YciS (DUF1049 family)